MCSASSRNGKEARGAGTERERGEERELHLEKPSITMSCCDGLPVDLHEKARWNRAKILLGSPNG